MLIQTTTQNQFDQPIELIARGYLTRVILSTTRLIGQTRSINATTPALVACSLHSPSPHRLFTHGQGRTLGGPSAPCHDQIPLDSRNLQHCDESSAREWSGVPLWPPTTNARARHRHVHRQFATPNPTCLKSAGAFLPISHR